MSVDLLREAAALARAMAETHRKIAPTLADLYDGDDCDSLASARRHDAVADWLDSEDMHQFGPTEHAINVARAYLGRSS